MKITIPKPCHENWNAMTREEKGRFCSVCSKTVLDFTVASDAEIMEVFSASKENICGNFYESQLNRNLQYSYINSLFTKFAVGFMMTAGGFVSVNAQQNVTNDTLKAGEIEDVVILSGKVKNQKMLVGSSTVVSQKDLMCAQKNNIQETVSKLSGLNINQIPESKSGKAKLTIRGAQSSVRDDQKPLVIIDRKERSFEELGEIDPDFIKTINIIKGESATALYSGKGKNGVILVTTKKKWKHKKQKTSSN